MKPFSYLVSAIFLFHPQLYATVMPDSDTFDLLRNGEVLLKSSDDAGTIRAQAIFNAPPKKIWETIFSCEQKFIYVNGLKKCEVLEKTTDKLLIHQVVKTSRFAPTLDFVYELLLSPYDSLHFELIEGNLKTLQGTWQFTEITGGTLVDYELQVQPDIPVPDFLVNNDVRKNTPRMLACIRGLAGGSGSAEQAKKDQQQCPGSR